MNNKNEPVGWCVRRNGKNNNCHYFVADYEASLCGKTLRGKGDRRLQLSNDTNGSSQCVRCAKIIKRPIILALLKTAHYRGFNDSASVWDYSDHTCEEFFEEFIAEVLRC